jgi:hypothetical protein
MTYGGSLPALTYTVTGLVNGDGPSTVSGVALSALASSTSHAGTYDITVTGGIDPDYVVSDLPGQLTITPAPLTITVNNATMTYRGTLPPLTYAISGLVNGDLPSVVSGVTLTTTATATSHVGPYSITAAGGMAQDYAIGYVPGALAVTPAPLTVRANNATMTYGEAVPVLSYTVSGFLGGDTSAVLSGAPVLSTSATAKSHVSTSPYKITITAGTLSASDYTIATLIGGALTITPAHLTVTANNLTKVYSAKMPALTYTLSGFVNGDTSAVVSGSAALWTSATAASPIGTYVISIGIGTLSASDYTFTTFVAGTLTVTRRK